MKKKLLLSILGMAAVSSFGQGVILLDNYNSNGGNGGPFFSYGYSVPGNGVSGGLGSGGLNDMWTAGIYFVVGTPSITDPAGYGMPDAALALGTGSGSTAQFDSVLVNNQRGYFLSQLPFNTGGPVGSTITAEIVAYDTADGSYAAAHYRMHTAPFTMTTASYSDPLIPLVGDAMIAAGINGTVPLPVGLAPEPSTLAFAGLGACLWMTSVRRKNF